MRGWKLIHSRTGHSHLFQESIVEHQWEEWQRKEANKVIHNGKEIKLYT